MDKKFEILDLIRADNNTESNCVLLRDLLLSKDYEKCVSDFTIPLGKDENGDLVVIDINSLKNLLVCGMSGRGKTSAIFNILISLIVQNEPENIKFVCIDSMGVDYFPFLHTQYSLFNYEEFSQMNVIQVLDFVIEELNNRLKSKKQTPKIVCVIDDFADIQSDLEIIKSNKFNDFVNLIPIMNTVGIYVIFSTSRVTKTFVTDKVKKIFYNRIAFALFNSNDSRMIIDQSGAEKLNFDKVGDCLLKTNKGTKRVRCSYIDNQDVVIILKSFNN